MEQKIFDFLSYKEFLEKRSGRGFRSQMAEAIGCQRAFISQVLQGEAHFNLEHGERLGRFLELGEEELHYFLLLIQYERAGTENLRRYFLQQLEALRAARLVLKNRIRSERELSPEDKSRYYSAWYYGAVRVAVTIPSLRTRGALAKRLGLSARKIGEILDFLVGAGLLELRGDEYHPTALHLHLGNDSSLIAKHHTNARLQAMKSLERDAAADLHYSVVVSLSEADAQDLRVLCVDFVEKLQKKVQPSKEEVLYSFAMDFFET
ncbi:MAG: TIGR02147 family protein [Bacteriovoracia bacterium]